MKLVTLALILGWASQVFSLNPVAILEQNQAEGCTEPFANFFDENPDPNRPCYSHICYPAEKPPYFEWRERFESNKCCQYSGYEFELGSIIVLGNELEHTEDCAPKSVVRCLVPEDNDAPLMPMLETQVANCCIYNGRKIEIGAIYNDFETCGLVNCTQENQIEHHILYEDGCCDMDGVMVGEGAIQIDGKETHLCHQGKIYQIKMNREDADEMDTSASSVCDCPENNLKSMAKTVDELISSKNIKSLHFILHGTSQEHKLSASLLSTQLKNLDKTSAFLSFYGHNDDGSAQVFYRWDHQCSSDDKCALSRIFNENFSHFASKNHSSNVDIANSVDLSFRSVTQMRGNSDNFPFCLQKRIMNSNFYEKLIIFFVGSDTQDKKIDFLEKVVGKYLAHGSILALVTFDQNVYRQIQPSPNIWPFFIEKLGLKAQENCVTNCECGQEIEQQDQRDLLMYKPAFIDTCVATFLTRQNLDSEITQKDVTCSEFETKHELVAVKEAIIPANFDDPEYESLLHEFNNLMDGRQRHAGYFGHEDEPTELMPCLQKYGFSMNAIFYCVHVISTNGN